MIHDVPCQTNHEVERQKKVAMEHTWIAKGNGHDAFKSWGVPVFGLMVQTDTLRNHFCENTGNAWNKISANRTVTKLAKHEFGKPKPYEINFWNTGNVRNMISANRNVTKSFLNTGTLAKHEFDKLKRYEIIFETPEMLQTWIRQTNTSRNHFFATRKRTKQNFGNPKCSETSTFTTKMRLKTHAAYLATRTSHRND